MQIHHVLWFIGALASVSVGIGFYACIKAERDFRSENHEPREESAST